MKKLLGAILFVTVTGINVWCQHLSEFNRLFTDPSADSGRMAITFSLAGYIVQSSQVQGFGNLSVTSHFFLNEDTEFRLGGGYGRNDNSYPEADINIIRLLTPSNYETYSGWLGLNRQFKVDDKLRLGLSFDYAYTFKNFNRMPTTGTSAHNLIFGAELSSVVLPLTLGATFNYINSEGASHTIPHLTGSVFRAWNFYCQIELSKRKRDNWKESKSLGKTRWNSALAFGPNVTILENDFADHIGLSNRFIVGASLKITGGVRFRVKAAK